MAILEISRDWGANPSIVRIVTDDDLESIINGSYLTDQAENIDQLNHGAFDWQDSDAALVYTNTNDTYFLQVFFNNGVPSLASPNSAKTITYKKDNADAAAADELDEFAFAEVNRVYVITGISFLPNAALTADNTDYATLSVYRRDLDGTNQGLIGEITTELLGSGGTGNWTAFNDLNITPANFKTGEDGAIFTFEITKAGSGVVVPSGTLLISFLTSR